MDTDQFDIEAKAEADAGVIPAEEMQLMVRSLLEDRFQLKAHVENRALPIYDLEQAQAEMDTISGNLAVAHPETNNGLSVRVVPLRDQVLGGSRTVGYACNG